MRTAFKTIGITALASLGAALGCSAAGGEHTGRTTGSEEAISMQHPLSHAPIMPVRRPGADPHKRHNRAVAEAQYQPQATSGAQLTYQGGPLLQTIKVYVVFWGGSVDASVKSGIGPYFSAITNSPYFDWLSEYDANGMSIGRGTFAGATTINPSTTSSSIDDSQIGPEIDAQITSGALPKNDGNSLYMVYFPPGVSITMGGSGSCSSFCAYHSTLQRQDGSYLFYGVMPDLGGSCANGCGGASQFDNTTEVSSHEMIEATTDPAVGVNVLSWYDNTNGEIGDICNFQTGTMAGYEVQLEWSNKNNACILQDPSGGGGSSGGGSSGSSGGGGSSSGSSSGGGSSSSSGSSSGGSSGGSSGSGSSSGGGGACAYSEQEPNDTAGYADDLSNGCLSGAVSPGTDVDDASFSLSGSYDYDVRLGAAGDATVVLYKWVQNAWAQVASTSPTEIHHVSSGGGTYLTVVSSPSQTVQDYTITLAVQ